MKKGLLLSLVASTMIFAGGDIAPVEPVADAPASDCKEFWGTVGFYYQTQDIAGSTSGLPVEANRDFFDLHEASVTAVLGYEGALGSTGLKFGAEVAGWTSLGLADLDTGVWNGDWWPRVMARTSEGGELSQLYLAYAAGNTAIKAGRFALPQVLSPFAWSDRNQGILDNTFEGVVVANTDVANTTIYGAYVHSIVDTSSAAWPLASNTNVAMRRYVGNILGGTNPDDEFGLFALGFVNTSIADTTITGVGYYLPSALIVGGTDYAVWALFGSVTTQIGGMKLEANAGYVDGDDFISANETFGASARLSTKFGAVDASLAASYINDGDYPIVVTAGSETSMLYTANEVNHQLAGAATVAVLAKLSAQVGPGTLWGTLGYWSADDAADTDGIGARIGYNFKVMGIDTTVNYRYYNETATGAADFTRQRIRVEAQYKF